MAVGWWHRAACKGMDSDLWYPNTQAGEGYADARLICGGCPVAKQCADEAIATGQQFGMWGGLTPYERGWSHTGASIRVPEYVGHGNKAGTTAGYYRERSQGLRPCIDCLGAYNKYVALRRSRRVKERAIA